MKFEVKTQNEDYSKSFFYVFATFVIILLIIILSSISMKLGKISRNHEISYICKLLTIEKSSSNFKKLSKLTNQTNKPKIWDLCREFLK